jgi:hypothetical protein
LPVLVEVVTRAERRCECTRRGCHGQGERCVRGLPASRLIAAPRDITVAPHAAWRVPVAELAAWCVKCFERAQADGRRERNAAATARLSAATLLDGAA